MATATQTFTGKLTAQSLSDFGVGVGDVLYGARTVPNPTAFHPDRVAVRIGAVNAGGVSVQLGYGDPLKYSLPTKNVGDDFTWSRAPWPAA